MADRAAPTKPNTGSNATTNAKQGDGNAWDYIDQGNLVREPSVVRNVVLPRKGRGPNPEPRGTQGV